VDTPQGSLPSQQLLPPLQWRYKPVVLDVAARKQACYPMRPPFNFNCASRAEIETLRQGLSYQDSLGIVARPLTIHPPPAICGSYPCDKLVFAEDKQLRKVRSQQRNPFAF